MMTKLKTIALPLSTHTFIEQTRLSKLCVSLECNGLAHEDVIPRHAQSHRGHNTLRKIGASTPKRKVQLTSLRSTHSQASFGVFLS